jgi:hypothetical protein
MGKLPCHPPQAIYDSLGPPSPQSIRIPPIACYPFKHAVHDEPIAYGVAGKPGPPIPLRQQSLRKFTIYTSLRHLDPYT